MKTAIITGASSGLGSEFVRQLADVFPEIQCCWLIARRRDRLEKLAVNLPGWTVECLPMDLCDPMSFVALQEKLNTQKPEVALQSLEAAAILHKAGVKVAVMTDLPANHLWYLPIAVGMCVGAGLDEMDRKILTVLIDHFNGGPVGVKTLAVACSEEIRTIEDIYEPYLIQCGFLNRTPRGRVATPKAYKHLNRLYGGTMQGSLI